MAGRIRPRSVHERRVDQRLSCATIVIPPRLAIRKTRLRSRRFPNLNRVTQTFNSNRRDVEGTESRSLLRSRISSTKQKGQGVGVELPLLTRVFLAQEMKLAKGQSHKVVANRDVEICFLTLRIP